MLAHARRLRRRAHRVRRVRDGRRRVDPGSPRHAGRRRRIGSRRRAGVASRYRLGDGDRARLLLEERRRSRRRRHPVRIEHVHERHDQGAREAHRDRLPRTRARHLVGQSHSGCGGARVQPRRGDVRCAVRHRQERAVPLRRRLPLLQRADELRAGQGRPGGFEIINIDGSQGGIGPGTLASWISTGSTRRCRSAGTTRTPGRSSRHRR